MRINCGFLGAPRARQELVDFRPHTTVSVGLDPGWTKELHRAPKPDKTKVPALIDTGAQESHLDSALAAQLKLPVVDKRIVAGVCRMLVDVCRAQVHVESLRYTIEGQFTVIPLAAHIGYHVILGRTFLRHCTLVYDGKLGDATLELNL
jgi:predicted aspartyl protease